MQDEKELVTEQQEEIISRETSEGGQAESSDRRKFLTRLGWGSLAGFLAINSAAFLRFFYPRVLFEPPSQFKVGLPADYPPGQVNSQYQREFGTWIIRLQDGAFFAMETKCTHLGCTPSWMDAQKKFKCPCHGSGYYITGLNFEGPAPRPMDRFKISIAEDGQLLVDKTIKFPGVPGKESNELYPQSLLRV
ncbi:MAG: ubiquinol-cytochrome c reductase iron-sulfur subunit [Chlorobium sp.]|jgi:cytochrome b6-f complex iron-sulfur subunit|nr:MAG: ubiquinol-cytochrome c reductase iron-sulfur subunit [Chlorobium sp.]